MGPLKCGGREVAPVLNGVAQGDMDVRYHFIPASPKKLFLDPVEGD